MVVPVSVSRAWSLAPDGLDLGDSFRLLFATSTTRNATSSGIVDYNNFVRNLAGGGHTDIRAYSSSFNVVGSTSAVDARDNTGTAHTDDEPGVPIYWLGGNKVADDYADFYDGDWADEANATDDDGNARSLSTFPFTGSQDDGTATIIGGISYVLGSTSGQVSVGRPDSVSGGPIGSNTTRTNTTLRPFYALSGVFQLRNNAPVFRDQLVSRRMFENTAAGQNVGDPVAASDLDSGDTLTYSLVGNEDDLAFTIVSTTGQIPDEVGSGATTTRRLSSTPWK